ncbi:2-dehydro-3-deoxyphosphogluconate aldolase/4- hydroxy-2-oxoglutarate aldolase (plasmid) [Haloterrigena turkmenica DSM 5511]|uniref:2-dehydro-3-deoxyphosphogluconate aldolase/4-hydroxy-2-oxoglutarate aldolase n=1 Tax=Haloterrigena turkmenica (strain ATCC 51198 / DSM 5511 / JCM 9101 / NCIMB 13204 / VKM B-1734 / 4k) TaxID=543526 RepID=D2S071_HALTV|nr:bifunctional 4-hydroxy-2-oxoglutarate aldolase/2-dehydro-3-deoxy-phosphogluconate aldolase [Haloterrigena turkmenica]ADB62768.1 2-dehydro-3-deoxyphosphogluconate aldolase/4- hydroxy-2-oxoglutarate aldolase [Haloterrigena turkmenica DSM 5511]
MSTREIEQIVDSGVIGILRGVEPDAAVDVASAVVDGGVTALEVTADTENVVETIDTLSSQFDDVLVGAGTVLDAETARAVQLAGAEFLVTPTVDTDVIEVSNRYGTPIASGAFTPTEALRAYEAGADFVKVFPAKTGGPEHVAAIGGPLSQIPLVPTGGVGPSNTEAYIEAGAVAVGAGSAIVEDETVASEDYATITENARRMVDAVESARN